MQVFWSERAKRDFNEIVAYIAEDSPQNATLVRRRVLHAATLLGVTPLAGTPGLRTLNREWVVSRTGFILRYHVGRDSVEIRSIVRGKRNRSK